jgi:hypothetical protein
METNGTITLNRKALLELRDKYQDREDQGRGYIEQAREMPETTDKERKAKQAMLEMYIYQTGKAAGFKEGIEEQFYKVDGKFPERTKKQDTEAVRI